MILFFGVALFVVGCILEACGRDWEASERNADRRADRIISAIGDASYSIKSSHESVAREQTEYLERLAIDCDKEGKFQDSHGRWFRRRLAYDEHGRVIAEEIVGIEQ